MIVAKKLSNSNGRRMKTTPWRFFKKKYFLTQESGMKKAHSSSKFLPRGELFGSQKKKYTQRISCAKPWPPTRTQQKSLASLVPRNLRIFGVIHDFRFLGQSSSSRTPSI